VFYLSNAGFTSINAATEEQELIFIPAEKERNMGRNLHPRILEHFDETVDPLTQNRVAELGKRLAAGSDRKDVIYRFNVLGHKKKNYYNAFAAPGGYIYIFEDLVNALKTDDKIAAVLAHEMGHVEARHSIKRMQANMAVSALMLLSSQVPNKEPGSYSAFNRAIGQLMSSYSRHDEKQADKLSIRYMKKAGFNPEGVVGALEELRKLRKKGPIMSYMIYKSHPYISERISYLRCDVEDGMDFDSYINLVEEEDDF
jgi:predicted Zn-dependent protease